MAANNELGSACWSNYKGLTRDEVRDKVGVLLGHPRGQKDRFFAWGVSRHFLSVAPTRCGKGVSLIIPNLLYYQGSCVVIDPKGENAWITAKYRREHLGQKVFILDPWGEVNRRYGAKAGELETIARFNPLSLLDPASPHYADDLAYIADALIINQGKDPHWDNSARELIAGLISYCVETKGPQVATLSMVRVLLTRPLSVIAEIAANSTELGHESVAARKLSRFASDSREISGIISTALTQTAFLDNQILGENLSYSDFSFSDLVDGLATIYLVLPVDKLQTYGRWLRLMISIGIRTVARNTRQLEAPVLFMLDEFGTIGRLSAVAQAFGLMAGLQMVMWAFVQDFVQLKRDYPEDWETFIANANAITAFNVGDNFTASYLSQLLGRGTVSKISMSSTESTSSEGLNYSNSLSEQIFARELLTPDEVRRAACGMIIRDAAPLVFDPIVYYTDPDFLPLVRIDPYHFEGKAAQINMVRANHARFLLEEMATFEQCEEMAVWAGYVVKKQRVEQELTAKLTADNEETEDYVYFVDEKEFIYWVHYELCIDNGYYPPPTLITSAEEKRKEEAAIRRRVGPPAPPALPEPEKPIEVLRGHTSSFLLWLKALVTQLVNSLFPPPPPPAPAVAETPPPPAPAVAETFKRREIKGYALNAPIKAVPTAARARKKRA